MLAGHFEVDLCVYHAVSYLYFVLQSELSTLKRASEFYAVLWFSRKFLGFTNAVQKWQFVIVIIFVIISIIIVVVVVITVIFIII